jgi:cytochrome c oxidase subunit 3
LKRTPFHLVDFSPWPLTAGLGGLFLLLGTASWMHGFRPTLILVGLLVVVLTSIAWWRDVVREGLLQGAHTEKVATGLRMGIILFILSEVCFFSAFFWGFFHRALGPNVEVGSSWPPVGIIGLDAFSTPLLNTIVLLSSAVRVTWAHHRLLAQDKNGVIWGLALTLVLGAYFTFLQAGEYYESFFTISDGVYGSCFYVATGFHGLHVLIGRLFLFICFLRALADGFSDTHHVGFEAAAWYWHFVDVVWLFLFCFVYWWAGRGA